MGDRQKTTKISRSGDPETSLRDQEADEKRRKWKEKRRADPAAPPRGSDQTTPPSQPQNVQGCIEADPRARLYHRRFEAHFSENITIWLRKPRSEAWARGDMGQVRRGWSRPAAA